MLLTIIVFFVLLATLVLVHELGHFVVARRNGVGAEEFGFGFPPRIVGTYRDKEGKRRWVWGNREIEQEIKNREETVYSINWIPLGGFVKIKGENGEEKNDPTSFAAKDIWTRFKILAAGVTMNLVLGVVLLTFAIWLGLPEAIDDTEVAPGSKVMITTVQSDGPAKEAGIKMGDEVVAIVKDEKETAITTVSGFQEIIKNNQDQALIVKVKRPGEEKTTELSVTPRAGEGQSEGKIGVGLARTKVVQHNFFESFFIALQNVFSMAVAIFIFLKDLIVGIFTPKEVAADVAGPVGIAILTGTAVRLGIAYLLNFAALLSINLAIINFLPLPALDGGRALFLLIEKIKGAPVSQKVEGFVHMVGFMFLLGVMVLVIFNDFITFNVIDRIKGIF